MARVGFPLILLETASAAQVVDVMCPQNFVPGRSQLRNVTAIAASKFVRVDDHQHILSGTVSDGGPAAFKDEEVDMSPIVGNRNTIGVGNLDSG